MFWKVMKRKRLMKVIFFKCIWEIRTDNPILVVKILNGTPRPILPREKESERMRDGGVVFLFPNLFHVNLINQFQEKFLSGKVSRKKSGKTPVVLILDGIS